MSNVSAPLESCKANPTLIAVLALLVMGEAISLTGILDRAARLVLRLGGGNRRMDAIFAIFRNEGKDVWACSIERSALPVAVVSWIDEIGGISRQWRISGWAEFRDISKSRHVFHSHRVKHSVEVVILMLKQPGMEPMRGELIGSPSSPTAAKWILVYRRTCP